MSVSSMEAGTKSVDMNFEVVVFRHVQIILDKAIRLIRWPSAHLS